MLESCFSVSFWQRCKLYTVSLKILLKGDFSKFLEELLFGTYDAPVRFLDRVENTEVSVTLLKDDGTSDALTVIAKHLGAYKGNTCGGTSFHYSYRWVDWTAQILTNHYRTF